MASAGDFADVSGLSAGGGGGGSTTTPTSTEIDLLQSVAAEARALQIPAENKSETIAVLEASLARAIVVLQKHASSNQPGPSYRKVRRQLALAFVGCLERLCHANNPLDAERWASSLRTQLLVGSDLEILEVDVLNNLAILYYSRQQYKRSLKV